MKSASVLRSVTLLCVCGAACGTLQLPRSPLLTPAAAAAPRSLPFHFERNAGQAPAEVEFLARGPEHTLFLTRDEAVLGLPPAASQAGDRRSQALRMRLVGARPAAPAGGGPLPGRVNYFLGRDPARWRRNVPTFDKVTYPQVYPGIDLVYHGTPEDGAGAFEYDFVVAAGSDPAAIAVELEGAAGFRLEPSGDLVMRTAAGELRQRRPVAYQQIDGRRIEIPCRFRLSPTPPHSRHPLRGYPATRIGFELAAYDKTRPLVIDPVVVFSTLLGGAGEDVAFRAALDGAGALHVSGWSTSIDFPLAVPFQGGNAGGFDAFFAKMNPTGTMLQYATYVGGSANDFGGPMDFGPNGSPYFAIDTFSADFPITPNAFDSTHDLDRDVAVVRLSPNGANLEFSTFFGGSGYDIAFGIDVGASGEATLTGETSSPNLPTSANAFQISPGGQTDAFAFRLNDTGTGLGWATYVGGSANDFVRVLAVDAMGSIHFTGTTYSPNFPVTPGALRVTWDGVGDAYVAKLSSDGSQLLLGTFLGGTSFDYGQGIAVDGNGSIYVSGSTESLNFPGVSAAFQRGHAGGVEDAFVAKLNPGGASLAWSSYYGGSGDESFFAVTLDRTGNPCLTGRTSSPNYFVGGNGLPDPFQATYGGGATDAMFTRLSSDGTSLRYSTFLGGPGADMGASILANQPGNVFVAGNSSESGFPTTPTAMQRIHRGGGNDAFVFRFDIAPAPPAGLTVSAFGKDVSLGRALGPPPVDRLRIMRKAGNGQFTLLSEIRSSFEDLPFTDGTAPFETPLIYRVFALDAGLTSAPLDLPITTLRAPFNFKLVKRTETSLEFGWKDMSKSETGYEIERRSGSGPWEILRTLPAGTEKSVDKGLGPFQTFTYRLKAIGPMATSAYTQELQAMTDSKVRGSLSVAASMVFGPVPIRTRVTQNLALTNTSQTERLRVDVSGVSSPFGVATTPQVFLDPGETEQLPVTFEPTKTRQFNGILQLVSTDPNNKRVRIALVGTGT
jgi:hypothetical protein